MMHVLNYPILIRDKKRIILKCGNCNIACTKRMNDQGEHDQMSDW